MISAIGGGGHYHKLGFDIDRRDGRYLRQRFNLAQQLEANWVTVTSWNEWFEGNQVEPSREYEFKRSGYLREMSAAFKGKPPSPLDGTALSAGQRSAGPRSEVSISNTGRRSIFCVTARGSGKGHPVAAYVLHPGESAAVVLEGRCNQVMGFSPTIRPYE